MSDYVLFAVLGLGTGAVYALLGLGLVVEYRSSGVVNFAHGAIAMFVAFAYAELRESGELLLPVVGIPSRIALSDNGLDFWTAFGISLIYAAVLGLAAYGLVFRALRRSPALGKVVASVGLMLLLQSVAVIEFGSSSVFVGPILPNDPVDFLGSTVAADRVLLAGLSLLLATVLVLLYRFTTFGRVTRAAAETEQGARLLGFSVDRIGALNWVLATVLAGVAGVLILPITSLNPGLYTLFIVPALAAALIGRFRNFGVTAIAGLAVGMLQSMVSQFQTDLGWLPDQGVQEAIPLVVILVTIVALGRRLPTRNEGDEGLPPRVGLPRRPWVTACAGVAASIAILPMLSSTYRLAFITSGLAAFLLLSLVVLTGYAGQISLAQAAFAAMGGVFVSKLAVDLSIGFPWSWILGALAAVPIGLIIGLPALRIRGTNLAIVTLAAAVTLDALVLRVPEFSGGTAGSEVPPPELFGISLDIERAQRSVFPSEVFGVFVVIVLALLCVAIANLRGSAAGRRLLALRTNERAAVSLGINVAGGKLYAFALSAFIAGLAGGLLGYRFGVISAEAFGPFVSVNLIAIAFIGGIGRISGAIVAGLLVAVGGVGNVLLGDLIADFRAYTNLVAGVGLLLVSIFNANGISYRMELDARRLGRAFIRRVAPGRAPASVNTRNAELGVPDADNANSEVARTTERLHAEHGPPRLQVSGLSVAFGGVVAVNDVSISVPRGSIVGLIGPNGAGKTTFVDAVTGFVQCRAGRISLEGDDITSLRPHHRVRRGIVRTFQTMELFEDLTAEENLSVAASPAARWGDARELVAPRPIARDDVREVLRLLDIEDVIDSMPTDLPHGRRRLVGVARAVMARPRLLLLDEPAAGLDTTESEHLEQQLRAVARSGIDILLVDHDMRLVLALCDYIYVLDFGRLIAEGAPSSIRGNEDVIAAYLGTLDYRETSTIATRPTASAMPIRDRSATSWHRS
jgi:ABC-type branched-subunit amino acid transport system ATPase component/ABC-type branched-subunit amino acid transport system permease subunit